jgi:hypothetical protein
MIIELGTVTEATRNTHVGSDVDATHEFILGG